jgi:hypothetical protein
MEIKETPFEDTQESFLGLMECFAKKADTDEFHPLNYQQLKNAQDKDKTIQKILKMPKTQYFCKDFHGGGKTTSLVCFKEKIVIPGRLQKHVINWYHTTLCHPGINRTEDTIGQHLYGICLGVPDCNGFCLYSIVFLYHFLKVLANKFASSIESYLCWPWISGEPFLFNDIGHSN